MNDAEYTRLSNGDTEIAIGDERFTLSPVEVARLIEFDNTHTRRPRVLRFPKWPTKESKHNG